MGMDVAMGQYRQLAECTSHIACKLVTQPPNQPYNENHGYTTGRYIHKLLSYHIRKLASVMTESVTPNDPFSHALLRSDLSTIHFRLTPWACGFIVFFGNLAARLVNVPLLRLVEL